jgi:dTDP-4-dehydrorhamnose reductase
MPKDKPKALVLGGSGFLGINFLRYCDSFNLTLTYSNSKPEIQADWRKFNFSLDDGIDLSTIIEDVAPDVVINCIALADVNRCEKDQKKARELNSLLPMLVSRVTENANIKFIQISTDHFKSKGDVPRTEESELWSTNVYGESKIVGEKLVSSENHKALILRTNFFGLSYKRHNSLLEQIINTLRINENFNGYSDVIFNPVSVIHLIRAIEHLYAINAKGTFNIVSDSVISKFDFAKLVAQVFELDVEGVIPSISKKDSSNVERPTYLALSPAKYKQTNPPIVPNIKDMLIELKEDTLWSETLRS